MTERGIQALHFDVAFIVDVDLVTLFEEPHVDNPNIFLIMGDQHDGAPGSRNCGRRAYPLVDR